MLESVQVPPETPAAVADVVLEAMRQNLLLDRLLAELTPAARRLLQRASLYRVPVTEDGFLVLDPDADERDVLANSHELVRRSLLETTEDVQLDLTFYELPPIVRQLTPGAEQFSEDESQQADLQALHARVAGYHEFQGRHVTRVLQDNLEAVYHYRLAERHEDADRLAESIANFYYRTSNYAAALALTGPIVARSAPLAPWWALNRHGMCLLAVGDIDDALALHERALPVAPEPRSRGTTLNNISGIYDARSDYDWALEYLEQSLQIRRQIGDKAGMTTTLHNMAMIAFQQKRDIERAFGYWGEALNYALETQNAQMIFHVAGTLGSIRAQMGQQNEARRLLGLAVQAGRAAGFPNVEQFEQMLAELG